MLSAQTMAAPVKGMFQLLSFVLLLDMSLLLVNFLTLQQVFQGPCIAWGPRIRCASGNGYD